MQAAMSVACTREPHPASGPLTLLAVLGGVGAVDVERLEHGEGQVLTREVLLNLDVACHGYSKRGGWSGRAE